MPAHIKLVVRREHVLIEHLERRLEKRRPRALKNQRTFLREAVVISRSSGPRGSGRLTVGAAKAGKAEGKV
jgi:hypothetical protein